jgi:hypothetical protein
MAISDSAPRRASPVSSAGAEEAISRRAAILTAVPRQAHLLAGDRHVCGGLVDHRVVNPADHRRAEQPGAGDLAAQLARAFAIGIDGLLRGQHDGLVRSGIDGQVDVDRY